MIKNVSMSGVVFTHDLNTGAPYYVINYDDRIKKTDIVTSGMGGAPTGTNSVILKKLIIIFKI